MKLPAIRFSQQYCFVRVLAISVCFFSSSFGEEKILTDYLRIILRSLLISIDIAQLAMAQNCNRQIDDLTS